MKMNEIDDWICNKIMEPMNVWARKHPKLPLIVSLIALLVAILRSEA